MKNFITLMLLMYALAGCDKKQIKDASGNVSKNCLQAEVTATGGGDCGYPMLSFYEDSAAIENITKQKQFEYIVINLPANFNIQGEKICVTVAALQPQEEFVCRTYGTAYPHLKIVSAEARE